MTGHDLRFAARDAVRENLCRPVIRPTRFFPGEQTKEVAQRDRCGKVLPGVYAREIVNFRVPSRPDQLRPATLFE